MSPEYVGLLLAVFALGVALAALLTQRRRPRDSGEAFSFSTAQKVLVLEGQVDVLKGQLTRATVPGESDSLMRTMLDAAPDAMLLVNVHGIIELANKRAESMFNWPTGAMTGLPLDELIPERFRERHRGHRGDYMANPHPRPMGLDLELWGRRSDGSEFPVEIGLSPYQRIGEDKKVVASVRDMTDRLPVRK